VKQNIFSLSSLAMAKNMSFI